MEMKCTQCGDGMMQPDAMDPTMMKCDKCGHMMKKEGSM